MWEFSGFHGCIDWIDVISESGREMGQRVEKSQKKGQGIDG